MPVTPNNTRQAHVKPELDITLVRASARLLKAYSDHRENGGWRTVAELVGVNVKYIYDLCIHNKAPSNPEVLKAILDFRAPGKEKQMDEEMQRLDEIMRTGHVGEANAIKKTGLLRELFGPHAAFDKSYNNPYDRRLRALIEELNHDFGGTICSSPKSGYWCAASLNEGLEAIERSTKRAVTQLDNARHLKNNLQREFGHQLELME